MTTPTPFGYFDLLETFPQPGCAICRLLERDVTRLLDTLLYEHPTDRVTQSEMRASRGLCHEHTWLLPRYNNALATAVLYNAVMDEMLQIMEQTPPDRAGGLARLRGDGNALAVALAPREPCPACEARDHAEARYVAALGENVTNEKLKAAWQQSDGLCLAHFRGALNTARDAESARLLVNAQRERWSQLKDELELFLHRMDAHYHQQMGTERTSWLRVLARVAGEKRSSD